MAQTTVQRLSAPRYTAGNWAVTGPARFRLRSRSREFQSAQAFTATGRRFMINSMKIRNLLTAAFVVSAGAMPAMAEVLESVEKVRDSRAWVGVVLMILLVLALVIAAFLGSKRGHLD